VFCVKTAQISAARTPYLLHEMACVSAELLPFVAETLRLVPLVLQEDAHVLEFLVLGLEPSIVVFQHSYLGDLHLIFIIQVAR
jgi:hypothetical protein